MLGFEIKKYIFNKVIIFVILGFVLMKCLISFLSLKIDVPYGINLYKGYMERWDGVLTETKAAQIEAENERLSTIMQVFNEKQEQYINGEIEFEEFNEYTEEYNLSHSQKQAFEPVYAKYLYFTEADDRVEFFYDLEIIEFIELFRTDFALVLLLCFVINIVYDLESRSDISIIIRSLPEGRHKFQRNKIIVALSFTLIITLIFCGIDIGLYSYKYSFAEWGRTIHSIQAYSGFPVNTDIFSSVILIIAAKIVYSVIIAGVTILVSRITKRMFLSVFISVVLFALPMAIM